MLQNFCYGFYRQTIQLSSFWFSANKRFQYNPQIVVSLNLGNTLRVLVRGYYFKLY